MDGELSVSDKEFLERFKDAKQLNMSYCNLRSLKNMPSLPKLEMLALMDNSLTGEDLHAITSNCRKLKELDLSNNCIRKADSLDHLAKLQQLKRMDLSANPVSDLSNYRATVFEKLP